MFWGIFGLRCQPTPPQSALRSCGGLFALSFRSGFFVLFQSVDSCGLERLQVTPQVFFWLVPHYNYKQLHSY